MNAYCGCYNRTIQRILVNAGIGGTVLWDSKVNAKTGQWGRFIRKLLTIKVTMSSLESAVSINCFDDNDRCGYTPQRE